MRKITFAHCLLWVKISRSGRLTNDGSYAPKRTNRVRLRSAIRRPSRKERLAAEEFRHILNADLVGSYCPLVTSRMKLRSSVNL
jgi:hypothetical protein